MDIKCLLRFFTTNNAIVTRFYTTYLGIYQAFYKFPIWTLLNTTVINRLLEFLKIKYYKNLFITHYCMSAKGHKQKAVSD